MGIIGTFKKSTAPSLFGTFKEVVIEVTYKEKTGQAHDATTGVTVTYQDYIGVKIIRREYATDELNNVVVPGDMEFKVLASTISVKPKSTNVFIVGNETWNIVSVIGAPVDDPVTYKCQCRRKS